jgi:transposase-like protein
VIAGIGQGRRWSDEDKARIMAESLNPATTSSAVSRRYGLHGIRRQTSVPVDRKSAEEQPLGR